MDSARELFMEKGYDGTSVRDIANASATNVAMVNYYFRSKLGLFEIIFREAFDILATRIFSVLNSDMPAFDVIETWIDTYYDLLAKYPQIPNFIFTAASHSKGTASGFVSEYDVGSVYAKFSAMVGKEAAEGKIKEYPAVDLALNIVSLCVFPFVVGPLVSEAAGIGGEQYREFLKEHKKHVIGFARNALRV